MAKMTIKGPEDYMNKLSALGKAATAICENAVEVGGGIMADEIRKSIRTIPNDKFRYLDKEEKFRGISEMQREDLLDHMGVTPVKVDHNGVINVKVGFAGYGSKPTRKYKKGVPNALLARAIESGSSVRIKFPFVRPAVSRAKEKAIEEMGKSIESDMKIYAL